MCYIYKDNQKSAYIQNIYWVYADYIRQLSYERTFSVPSRSEDDFFPANPNGAWPCSIQRQGARFAVRKRNMDYNTMLLFINLKKNYFSRLYT